MSTESSSYFVDTSGGSSAASSSYSSGSGSTYSYTEESYSSYDDDYSSDDAAPRARSRSANLFSRDNSSGTDASSVDGIDFAAVAGGRRSVKNPVQIEWSNLYYDVKDIAAKDGKNGDDGDGKGEKAEAPPNFPKPRKGAPKLAEGRKRVLHGISGYAAPGTFTAVCGPSGAGKTSFLRILARRISASAGGATSLNGKVTINGEEVDDTAFRSVAAFVAQDDVLMGSLTVKETFDFAAGLRGAADGADPEAIQKRANGLIRDLGLTQCADTYNGYTGTAAANSGIKRGISGGERKRVSIGLELLTDPTLLLLDEPTTGLDSYAAKSTCLHLARLSRQGRTVIATLHQPSHAMFRMFDNLIILGEGRTLYNGPARDAEAYFASHGFNVPPRRNPADYFIKILFLGKGKGGLELEAGEQQLEHADKGQVALLARNYADSDMARDERRPPKPPAPLSARPKEDASGRGGSMAPWHVQLRSVMSRSFRNQAREPLLGVARFGQGIFLAVLFGLVYLQLSRDQIGVSDRSGALFFTLVTQAFGSMNAPLFVFPSERGVYYRESASGLYSTSAYYIGKVISELPVNILAPFVFCAIVYPMVGFNGGFEPFFVYSGILVLLTQIPYAVGLVISTAIKNQAVAIQVQPAVMLPVMLLAGFYISTESIPVWIRWLGHLSFIRYGFRAAAINEYKGETFICSERDQNQNSTCPILTGEQQLQFLGFEDNQIWEDCLIMVAMYVGCLLLSYLFLRCAKKE